MSSYLFTRSNSVSKIAANIIELTHVTNNIEINERKTRPEQTNWCNITEQNQFAIGVEIPGIKAISRQNVDIILGSVKIVDLL